MFRKISLENISTSQLKKIKIRQSEILCVAYLLFSTNRKKIDEH